MKATKPARKRGRPSGYTREIGATICERIAAGETLVDICKTPGMPKVSTVLGRWLSAHPEFATLYARAKETRLDVMAEEILQIADDATNDTKHLESGDYPDSEWINRSRLRVDSRKWLLAKLRAKTYGDRLALADDADSPLGAAAAVLRERRSKRSGTPKTA